MDRDFPAPLFIVCPIRSFSSVICAMLGQHPQMFAMPELNLFIADTVAGLLNPPKPHFKDGLLRAVAYLHHGEQTENTVREAERWLAERGHWSSTELLSYLARSVAPRVLIDKSPATVMRSDFLERSYRACPEASYLHLTRHPRPNCESIIRLLERSHEWGGLLRGNRVDPERVWTNAHQNIREFSKRLVLGQYMHLRGEDFLESIETFFPQIAEWLAVDNSDEHLDAIRHPERSVFACRGPANAVYGNDPNFLDNPSFDPSRRPTRSARLDGPLAWNDAAEFSAGTRKLALEFGYE